jgi:twitching motility protein PilT
MNYDQLLKFGVDQGASAIHLQTESTPQLRIGGLIRGVDGPRIKADELRAFTASIAPKSVGDDLERAFTAGSTFSASTAAGRFACSTYSHIGGPGLVLRVIPSKILSLEELNLPSAVRELALAGHGLVLVVGPGRSGKSATLAAMVDLLNTTAYQKIVTIESPVEYVHASKKALISQMEVGQSASSYEHGTELALQQDADVIVLGELRGATAARMALAAAEAGRKVLATMIGRRAIHAIEQFITMIPKDEQVAAMSLFAAELEGIIAQQLARTRDGKFRPAVEIFRGGIQTSKAIQENRLKDLTFFIEGRRGGMQSLDQHLIELYLGGVISGTEAMRLAANPETVGESLRAARQAPTAPGSAGQAP